MSQSKRYLEVPFAQKDQAKALGARWDPARRKWYVPAGVALAPFAAWIPAGAGDSDPTPVTPDGVTIAQTAPADPGFVPYCGDTPPWD